MPAPPDAWTRLERFLADHLPALADALAPPADAASLDALATRTGLDVRPVLDALYGVHDGQSADAPGLFAGLRFLPIADAADEWTRWADLVRDDPALLADVAVSSLPDGAARPVYYSPAWIPVATDGAGNGLAVDFDPGPAGTLGQVLSFGPDESVRRVIAPSAAALVAWLADACDDGTVTAAPDPDAPGGLSLRAAGAQHLLDAAPALFGDA